MKKLLAALLVLFATGAYAQNYLRDTGVFQPVTTGSADGQLLANIGGQLVGVTIGANLSLSGGVLSATGGGGGSSPGGSNGQSQYNAAGSFGGYTVGGDATLNTSTGALTLASVNSNTGIIGSVGAIPILTLNDKGQVTAATTAPTRELLQGSRTYFYRANGSDTTCNGQTNASAASAPNCAFATSAKGLAVIAGNIDFNGQAVTLMIGDSGTYTLPINITSCWVGGGSLTIDLGGGTINVTGNIGIQISCNVPSTITIQNGTVSGNSGGIAHSGIGIVVVGTNMTMATTSGRDFQATSPGAYLELSFNTINIANGTTAGNLILAADQGRVDAVFTTFNFTGNCTYGTVVFAERLAEVILLGSTWQTNGNTISGVRYNVTLNSLIDTNGAGTTLIPGSSPGTGTNAGVSPYGLYN